MKKRWILLGAIVLFNACGGEKSPTAPKPIKPTQTFTLRVIADSAAVTGSPQTGVQSYPAGTRVTYSYSPANGYENITVVIDETPAPSSATITMTRDHAIVAGAEKIVLLPVEAEPLLASAKQLITAGDKRAAYRDYIAELDKLYRTRSSAEARDLVLAANRAAWDVVRDSAELRAVHTANGGEIFWLADHANSSIAPQLSSQFGSATSQMTLICVNGIWTKEDDARANCIDILLAASEAGIDGRLLKVGYFYNRSEVYVKDPNATCAFRVFAQPNRSSASITANLYACYGKVVDFAEAARQVLNLLNNFPNEAESDAERLAELVRTERAAGNSVLLVGHSQGTLMIQQALKLLGDADACVLSVSLAGPLSMGTWPYDSPVGFVVKGLRTQDAILRLGFNDFPRVATNLTNAADARVARASSPFVTLGMFIWAESIKFNEDVRLHSLSTSYLAGIESRQALKDALVSHVAALDNAPECGLPTDQRLYASSGTGTNLPPSNLWIVPPTATGMDTLISIIRTTGNFQPVITDVAFAPDRTFWGTSFNALWQIDTVSAQATLFGQYAGVSTVNALAFDANGVLFAVTTDGQLAEIDIATRRLVIRGSYGSNLSSPGDIVFAPDGRLFATVQDMTGTNYLATVDPTTGKATLVQPGVPIGFNKTWGLAFSGGELFGLTTNVGGKGMLIRIDLASGVGSFIRNLAFNAFGAGAVRAPLKKP